jgi:hypothetical protein
LLRFEERDDFADGIPQGVNGALGSCAQKRFKESSKSSRI